MTKEAIIEKTIEAIRQLPEDKAEEISDFADFVRKRYEENQITQDIQNLAADSDTFKFLDNEEELYSLAQQHPQEQIRMHPTWPQTPKGLTLLRSTMQKSL